VALVQNKRFFPITVAADDIASSAMLRQHLGCKQQLPIDRKKAIAMLAIAIVDNWKN